VPKIQCNMSLVDVESESRLRQKVQEVSDHGQFGRTTDQALSGGSRRDGTGGPFLSRRIAQH
jgi:hypothetical protein